MTDSQFDSFLNEKMGLLQEEFDNTGLFGNTKGMLLFKLMLQGKVR